jgi:hypothetical protein
MKRKRSITSIVALMSAFLLFSHIGFAAIDEGHNVTSNLWVKAVLEVPGSPVTLVWKMVGTDITPSGDQVIGGYFYADPADFAYGSEYNPEVFVKIYIAKNGWCNIAFNHVTVDDVTVYSAHHYAGVPNKTGIVSLSSRLVEHQYDGVKIDEERATGKIPDTGQTASYTNTFGEDSDYVINPPSYTKLDAYGNDLPDSAASWVMVKDNITGLIWENKTDDGSIHDKDNTYTWYDPDIATNHGNAGTPGNGTDTKDFIDALNASNFGGHSDWRLPTVTELSMLVKAGRYNPSIDTVYFQNTQPSYYWSSTSAVSSDYLDFAWRVYFQYGSVGANAKSYSCHARAVRGVTAPIDELMDNGDGTVTDIKTGLMWQKGEAGAMTWESALTFCENLQLGNHSDWRLPNRNELQSLVNYSESDPAIIGAAFPGVMPDFYWSSTADTYYLDRAWYVTFNYGGVYSDQLSVNYYVRAVRGGR